MLAPLQWELSACLLTTAEEDGLADLGQRSLSNSVSDYKHLTGEEATVASTCIHRSIVCKHWKLEPQEDLANYQSSPCWERLCQFSSGLKL